MTGSTLATAQGFPPIAGADAELLILGSFPGLASLSAGEYYAHPRNAFWPIMGELVGAHPELEYNARLRRIIAHHIAVWDVLRACHRTGSLDANIDASGLIGNDFGYFFSTHPAIRRIYFNGATAERLFRRYVLPSLTEFNKALYRLPSTSPAHAGLSIMQKRQCWSIILGRPDE
jgi:double-stranded uracil-DNA glycosylase